MAYLPIPFDVEFLDDTATPIAGAAPTITIRNSAGTAVVTAAAMTEYTSEGGAAYRYDYTPVAAGTYRGTASTAHADATQPIVLIGNSTAIDDSGGGGATPEEISDAVWGADSRTLTGPTVTFSSPFDGNSENIILVRGDDYTTGDDGRALEWSGTNWPVLTGGSIALLMRSVSAPADVQSYAGTVVDVDTARVELTHTQTGALDVSSNRNQPAYHFALVATLADATIVTLVRGNVVVRRNPTNL